LIPRLFIQAPHFDVELRLCISSVAGAAARAARRCAPCAQFSSRRSDNRAPRSMVSRAWEINRNPACPDEGREESAAADDEGPLAIGREFWFFPPGFSELSASPCPDAGRVRRVLAFFGLFDCSFALWVLCALCAFSVSSV